MICTVIKGLTLTDIHQQISQALACSDLVELRIDYYKDLNINDLKELRESFSIPMLFTLRSKSQGGNYLDSEEKRLEDIESLAAIEPEYIDLESHIPETFIKNLMMKYPNIKLIISYHNFNETPTDLDAILKDMKKVPAYFYKIAVSAQNTIDALRFFNWSKTHENLIAISMGYHGQISRIVAPILGCPMTYAALDEGLESAPGQLTAHTLVDRYRHHSLSKETALYGLIGDPVDKSISDETHNDFFKSTGIDAVYVKMQVTPEQLPEFLQYARQLPFKGLSVTMPLKEHIMKHIDHIDVQAKEIGAVNTLVFKDNYIEGYNTDGFGALDPIEEVCKVQNKRVVILGAGGAAKAIAHEAKRRGVVVTILNRNQERALALGQQLGCNAGNLNEMSQFAKDGYDILINCTPLSMPIPPKDILSNSIVMDIVTNPKEATFLDTAKEKGCHVIQGRQMFFAQARGQFKLWFEDIC